MLIFENQLTTITNSARQVTHDGCLHGENIRPLDYLRLPLSPANILAEVTQVVILHLLCRYWASIVLEFTTS